MGRYTTVDEKINTVISRMHEFCPFSINSTCLSTWSCLAEVAITRIDRVYRRSCSTRLQLDQRCQPRNSTLILPSTQMSVPVIEREAHANHSTKAPRLALARCGERTHRPLGMSIVVPPLPKKGHLLVPNPNGDRVVRLRSPRSSITSKQTKLLLKVEEYERREKGRVRR